MSERIVIQGASRSPFPPSRCVVCERAFSPFDRARITETGRLAHPDCLKEATK